MAKTHVAFCDALKTLILDLAVYVKEYHLSGLLWNVNGIPIEEPEAAATATRRYIYTRLGARVGARYGDSFADDFSCDRIMGK